MVGASDGGNLASHEYVNLAAVILIVGQAFIYLCPRQIGEAVLANDAIYGLSVMEESDDVVNPDTSSLDARSPAADSGRAHDVAIGGRNGIHGAKAGHVCCEGQAHT